MKRRFATALRVATSILAFAVLLLSLWGGLALWYRLPASDWTRLIVAELFGLLGIVTAVALFSRFRATALGTFVVALGMVVLWWGTIKPPAQVNWAPDVARQVTGKVDGNLLTLTGVRNFEWRSNTDFTERWETRTYDLAQLQTVDLFLSYWAGPTMAHVIVSFGFANGDYLAWSIEVRRSAGGKFSPIADLFKSNPLVIVAADERDVVGVRSNVRGEDVQLYRLNTSPQAARSVLLAYVAHANALVAAPQFYNSVTTNCTTTIVKMMRAVGDRLPLDWRLIVNGYLPDYAYDHGALDSRVPLAGLKAAAHIDERAREAGLSSPDFARLIRVGVPSPATSR